MSEYIKKDDAILAIQRYGVGCFDPDDFSPEQTERFIIARLNDIPSIKLELEDAVSRKQAIEAAKSIIEYPGDMKLLTILRMLQELPPITRKRG